MKKIKGGKRAGAGRKPTGKTTEVISFSVPKERVREIKDLVKIILSQTTKEAKVVEFHAKNIVHTIDEVEKIHNGEKPAVTMDEWLNAEKRIGELKIELKNPPKSLSVSKKIWMAVREDEIRKLQNLLKLSNR